jgi:hypothetical protein
MASDELTDEQKRYYLEQARKMYAHKSDDMLEIDDPTEYSVGEDGVWVKAWVLVPLRSEDTEGGEQGDGR